MGKAVVRISSDIIIHSLLLLHDYELARMWIDKEYSKRSILALEVESPDLPDEPTEREITPIFEQKLDEQGRPWYRMVRIEGVET